MAPVLHVITDPDRRGAQVFAGRLAEALNRVGLMSRVVALGPADRPHDCLPVEVLGPSKRHPTTLHALRREMAAAQVTVAHGSTTLPMCVLASCGRRGRLVYRQVSDQRFWANTPRRRLQTRISLHRVDRVVALWSGSAAVLHEDFRVPEGRIVVIPNGVPADSLPPITPADRVAARSRYGLEPSVRVVAVVAALEPEKCVDDVIRAFAQPGMDSWKLLVVGDGNDRLTLQRLAEDLAPGRVQFLGNVKQVRGALAAADVVALPSRSEGMPAVLIEAGLLGLPVVATPVGAVPEVVVDGVTGRIITFGDVEAAAHALSEVAEQASTLGAAARERCIEQFEMGPVAARWAMVLRDVLARSGAANVEGWIG